MFNETVPLARKDVNRLGEQSCSTEKRRYQKRKRAEDEQRTRARIVDAAEALHAALGPAKTSISAIADRAGVTRATVYRHFPDEASLLMACTGQWLARQPVVDPDRWTRHEDALTRFRKGLADVYGFYRSGEEMLTMIDRDAESMPPRVVQDRVAAERRWLTTLMEPFPPGRRRRVRPAVAHAIAFSTWRSLCVMQGLSNRQAIDLVAGMVRCALGADEGRRSPQDDAPA